MDIQNNPVGFYSNNSNAARTQKSKSKGLPKQLKYSSNTDIKLNKQGSQSKLDKRPSGRQCENQQLEMVKAFRVHARLQLHEEQVLYSLKLLGYRCQGAQDYVKFSKLWSKWGKDYVDEQIFKSIADELRNKGQFRDNKNIFDTLTLGANVLDRKRLQLIAKEIGRDATGLLQFCGKDGVIDFSQFDSILKFTNALT